MKRRHPSPADPPTPEFNWLDAATMARRRRDRSFKQAGKRRHQQPEAWAPEDIARHVAPGEKPLRD
jgi:hypothetical protein